MKTISPFTLARLEDKDIEFDTSNQTTETRIGPTMTLADLASCLREFADWYPKAIEYVNRQQMPSRRYDELQVSAIVSGYRQRLLDSPGFKDLRSFFLSRRGEEITVEACGQIIGELIREKKLSAEDAECMTLPEAVNTLQTECNGNPPSNSPGNRATFPNIASDSKSHVVNLTQRDKCALSILRNNCGKGMTGQQLSDALSKRKHFTSAATIRRHVIPKLRDHGVKNDRSRGGYYLDDKRSAK